MNTKYFKITYKVGENGENTETWAGSNIVDVITGFCEDAKYDNPEIIKQIVKVEQA